MGVYFFWGLIKGLKTQRNYIIILIIIMMMMDSRDDVGFSSVSWIRQGLLGVGPSQGQSLSKLSLDKNKHSVWNCFEIRI
jgi:hypothetical protein